MNEISMAVGNKQVQVTIHGFDTKNKERVIIYNHSFFTLFQHTAK